MATLTFLRLGTVTLGFFFCNVFAFAPIPLQDFCVADLRSKEKINGLPCKDPSTVKVDDFFHSGLHLPLNTSNKLGSGVAFVSVNQIPGLNTQGLLLGRADYAPQGFTPPHVHARAAEILTVLEGSILVGFVSSFPNFKHFSKTLNKGDVFTVPQGLIHYIYNAGKQKAVALFAFNSQDAGVIPITYNIFGAKPQINADFLAKAFQLAKIERNMNPGKLSRRNLL